MESFLKLAENRYSCRLYKNDKIKEEDLSYILECARLSPSACNKQPWKIYVIKSREVLQKVYDSYNRDWLKTAPMVIVLCGKHSEAWHRPNDGKDHTDVDLSIMAEHIALAAADNGLSTCWICNFEKSKLEEAIGLDSADEEPIVMMPIGYSADDDKTHAKTRKSLEEIVIYK